MPPLRLAFLTFFVLAVGPGALRPAAAAAQRSGRAATPAVTPRTDSAAAYRQLASDVFLELNRARVDPRAYAAVLDTVGGWYQGRMMRRPGAGFVLETEEGVSAVREAIRVLRGLAPMPSFTRSLGLDLAATDHVRDQGATGRTGHVGSDGSHMTDRANRHGTWDVMITENIAYGPLDARGMVVGLIVDDGVPDRGHRLNVFDPRVHVVGVACGPHRTYGRMCVIDHAARYTERASASH